VDAESVLLARLAMRRPVRFEGDVAVYSLCGGRYEVGVDWEAPPGRRIAYVSRGGRLVYHGFYLQGALGPGLMPLSTVLRHLILCL